MNIFRSALRSLCFAALLAACAGPLAAQTAGRQRLSKTAAVSFGQDAAGAAASAGKGWRKHAPEDPNARKGVEQEFDALGARLKFDSGRLQEITYTEKFDFAQPLTPFRAEWKNFPPIGGKRLRARMSREAALAYIKEWEKRAARLGARRVDAIPFKGPDEYTLTVDDDPMVLLISIAMGPGRLTGRGGFWSDHWSIGFKTDDYSGAPYGYLEEIQASDDSFNTMGR